MEGVHQTKPNPCLFEWMGILENAFNWHSDQPQFQIQPGYKQTVLFSWPIYPLVIAGPQVTNYNDIGSSLVTLKEIPDLRLNPRGCLQFSITWITEPTTVPRQTAKNCEMLKLFFS